MNKTAASTFQYSKQFDGVRGLLMLTIFILHLHFEYIKVPTTLANFTLHCFFLSSGYLITSILLLSKSKASSFKQFFLVYYIKRILRIFPVYFGYLLVFLIISIGVKLVFKHDFMGVITEYKEFGIYLISFLYNFKDLICIFFKNNELGSSSMFGHLWSISMEEQFYIIIPFLVYFLSLKSLKRLSIIMIVAFAIIRVIGFAVLKTKTDNNLLIGFCMIRCTLFQFDSFFYGILAALIVDKNIIFIRRMFYLSIIALIISECANLYKIQMLYGIPFYEMMSRYDIYALSGSAQYIDILLNVSCFFFILLLFETQNEFPLLLNKKLVEYGKYAYGAYVYQYIFILITYFFLFDNLKHRIPLIFTEIICTLFCTAGILLFSKLSFHKFEMPIINLRSKLTKFFV